MATVLAAVVSLGLLAVLWFGMQLGSAVLSRHRAEGAADLAALAAAAYAPRGKQVACDRAAWVAGRMHATIRSCRLDGWQARVQVSVQLPGILSELDVPGQSGGALGPVNARARAGPVRESGTPR